MADNGSVAGAAIMQIAEGFWLSRALWVAARLRIADAIGDEPVAVERVAEATNTLPDALRRLLTALSAFGVFTSAPDGGFAHSPVSRLLRSDHPSSQRAFVESIIGNEHYEAWGAIEGAVRTGKAAFELHFGMNAFDWFPDNPQAARLFGEAMTGTTRQVEDAVLAAHDFGAFELGVDVGGSEGSLLRRLLARYPAARGIVFDLPGAAATAPQAWRDDPVADRLEAIGGDFFASVPEGGDLYLLKFILHDWDDERSALILRNIRKAIRPDGRVAIVEMVLPDDNSPHPGRLMDLNMLAMTGGRERSAAEYAALLEPAGFRTESLTPTASPMSVLIARPV